MSKITETVALLAAPLAERQGLEIWDVEYKKEAGQWYLRIFLDKSGGVTMNDCETFSREMDPLLDTADPIPDSYIFEVSSAGAERELKRPSDFARFMGETVEVKLYRPRQEGKSFVGKLTGYDGGDVRLEAAGREYAFGKAEVAQVRLRIV